MPVAESGSGAGRQAVLVALAGFASAIGLVLLVTQISRATTSTDVGFGAGAFFQAGNAADLAEAIRQDGPLPLSDVAGGTRDIILQHVGDNDETGWRAFAARPDDAGRHCVATWNNDDEVFELLSQDSSIGEPCPEKTYPADGEGLDQLPVTVNDGIVTVDINAAERASTTTTEGS